MNICKKCGRIVGKKEHKCPNINPFKNKKHSIESRKKISIANKNHKVSDKTKDKLSNLFRGDKNPFYNKKHSDKSIKIMSEKAKLRIKEKSPAWKGGKTKSRGYIQILSPNHPYKNMRRYVFEHRLVMEKHIGRVLLPTEVVHHINENHEDNRIENLMLFSNTTEHLNHHRRIKNGMG